MAADSLRVAKEAGAPMKVHLLVCIKLWHHVPSSTAEHFEIRIATAVPESSQSKQTVFRRLGSQGRSTIRAVKRGTRPPLGSFRGGGTPTLAGERTIGCLTCTATENLMASWFFCLGARLRCCRKLGASGASGTECKF